MSHARDYCLPFRATFSPRGSGSLLLRDSPPPGTSVRYDEPDPRNYGPAAGKQDRHEDDLDERGAPAHPPGLDVDITVEELAKRACRLAIRGHVPRHHR